jgi:uncharacterized protein DUF4383
MRPLASAEGAPSGLDVRSGHRWTPARWFLLATAVWHMPLGVAGFFVNRSFPIGPDATKSAGSAHAFGVFETNGWHSLLALILGVVALYFTLNPGRARSVALAIGVIHVGVVASLILQDPATFWIASNDADQIVHLSSAIGGIACGLLTPSSEPAPPAGVTV